MAKGGDAGRHTPMAFKADCHLVAYRRAVASEIATRLRRTYAGQFRLSGVRAIQAWPREDGRARLGRARQPDEPLLDRHRDVAWAVQDACERAELAVITRAIVSLAQALNLKTVAEGVEQIQEKTYLEV